MLLVGAGLLLASFQRVLAVAPGFSPAHVLTARVSLPAARYKGDPEARTFAARLLERFAPPGRPAGGHHLEHSFRRRLQRQRHPGRGLPDEARRVADLAVPRPRDAGLLRDARHRAPRRTALQRQRHQRGAEGRHRGRTARPPLLGIVEPIGRRLYQPDSPEDLDGARTEGPLVHRRGRRRRNPDGGPGDGRRSRRRLLLPLRAASFVVDDARRPDRGRSDARRRLAPRGSQVDRSGASALRRQ